MRSANNNNNTQTQTILENNVQEESTRPVGIQAHHIQDLNAINNPENNTAFAQIMRSRRTNNNSASEISTTNTTHSQTTTPTTTTTTTTQSDSTTLPSEGITQQTPSTHEVLLERQQRNTQLQNDIRPRGRPSEHVEVQHNGDVDLENLAQAADRNAEQLLNHANHFQNAAQQHQQHADAFHHLAHNRPSFLNTIYNAIITWVPNHPFMSLAIFGGSFFMIVFVFRRVGGNLASYTSNIIQIGAPTGTAIATRSNNGQNIDTTNMQQYIQLCIDRFNNLGSFGGVLFVLRRVFRR